MDAHYVDRLSDADLALLARAGGMRGEDAPRLRNHPELVEHLMGLPETHRLLYGDGPERDPFSHASPLLTFATLVHRCADDLRDATFVPEWFGPRRRLPVFDIDALRDFLREPDHRLFLADLLASYTHVSSGTFVVKGPRGMRRVRFSELDPAALASLLEVLPATDHAVVFRRLGDLMLFLTGVFPDHSSRWGSPREMERLARLGADDEGEATTDGGGPGVGELALFERLGDRFYRMAAKRSRRAARRAADTLERVAGSFSPARRILNLVTDRYLFPFRAHWFR